MKRKLFIALLALVLAATPAGAMAAEVPDQAGAAEMSAEAGTAVEEEPPTESPELQPAEGELPPEGEDPDIEEIWDEEEDAGFGDTDQELVQEGALGRFVEGPAGKTYYESEGKRVTGFVEADGDTYYFAEPDGAMKRGLADIGGGTYIFGQDGRMLFDWQEAGGASYYLGTDGRAVTGFQKIDGRLYYFGPDGRLFDKTWLTAGGRQYYIGSDRVIRTGWNRINGFMYYMGEDGAIRTGYQTIDGKLYYFWPKTENGHYKGTMFNKPWQYIGSAQIYCKDGAIATGWNTINGFSYYMDPETGEIYRGWRTVDGKKYYFWEDTAKGHYRNTLAKNWNVINTFWYYMGPDGEIRTGWQDIGGKKYYFWPATEKGHYRGCLAEGFNTIDGSVHFISKQDGLASVLPEMKITAIDYGKDDDLYGDAVLLQSGGKYLLMDTLMPDPSKGTIVKWLKDHGIRDLDIYISHYHNDHIGNLPYILNDPYFNVGTIYVPPHSYMEGKNQYWNFWKHEQIWQKAKKAANSKGVRIVTLKKGSRFSFGSIKAEVLWQRNAVPDYRGFNSFDTCVEAINCCSLVTMFTCGDVRYLTAGDIHTREEKKILAAGIDVDADIFKLSHHGYGTSNSTAFLSAVSPGYMISTCPDVKGHRPEDSIFGGWEIAHRAVNYGNLMNTCYNGDITFDVKYGRISMRAERKTKQISRDVVNIETGKNTTAKATVSSGTSKTYFPAKAAPYGYKKVK